MIPILMQNTTVLGFLADATSCVVTEERNGVFELTLTYPVTGALFDKLQIDRFVKEKPNDTADLQLFRIYEETKLMNGVVTVKARPATMWDKLIYAVIGAAGAAIITYLIGGRT